MSKSTILVFAAAMAFFTSITPPGALADTLTFDPDVAYSATRIIEGAEQRIEQRYFQQDAATQRMETHLHGQQSTIIINAQRGVMIMMMPGQRTYFESAIDGRTFDGMNVELPDPASWVSERVGRESVNGVPATKFLVATDAGATTRMRGHVWVSDHGIPVRSDMESGADRIRMELRDLVVGAQPNELFAPPADYTRMAFGDGMTGGSGGAAFPAMDSSPAATDRSSGQDSSEPGFIGELSDEAAEEAKRATKDEVRGTVNETVRRGLRGILRGN